MIFHEIDGKKLGEVRTEDFLNFITDHIFFRFFDSGRTGIQYATTDLVDCLIKLFEDRGELNKGQIDDTQYQELNRDAQKLIVNGLIEEGTTGIYNAAFKMYNYIGQLPKKPAKKK
jgi:hypothetical protein